MPSLPENFSPENRLAILQGMGDPRGWLSLDEQRLCVRCLQLFTGHDLRISATATGAYDVRCPTHDCDSLPMHWFFHGSASARREPARSPRRQVEIDFRAW